MDAKFQQRLALLLAFAPFLLILFLSLSLYVAVLISLIIGATEPFGSGGCWELTAAITGREPSVCSHHQDFTAIWCQSAFSHAHCPNPVNPPSQQFHVLGQCYIGVAEVWSSVGHSWGSGSDQSLGHQNTKHGCGNCDRVTTGHVGAHAS